MNRQGIAVRVAWSSVVVAFAAAVLWLWVMSPASGLGWDAQMRAVDIIWMVIPSALLLALVAGLAGLLLNARRGGGRRGILLLACLSAVALGWLLWRLILEGTRH